MGGFISKPVPSFAGVPDFGDTFDIEPVILTDVFDYATGMEKGLTVQKGIPC